jgi:tetratricopeptide (TPR) repeat protein
MRRFLVFFALLALLGASLAGAADPNWEAGVKAFQAQNFPAAVAAFQKYVEGGGDNYEGHLMLGQALLKTKQYATAASHLQRALEVKPGDPTVQLALGQSLLLAGKKADACRTLQAVSEASLPAANKTVLYQLRAKAECGGGVALADLKKIAEAKNDAASWAAYGSMAVAEGDLATGASALDRAVKLDGNDARIRKSHVRALIQQARSSAGSQKDAAYAKAVPAAEALLRVESSFDNQLLLGEVQMGAKQYDQSVASFRRAAGMNATAWLPLFYTGQALTALDRYGEAMEPLNKAMSLARSAEDQRKIYNQLGFVHEKLKNWAESIVNYEKAGNAGAVARVQQNQETEKFNASVEEHNKLIDELADEQRRLKEELDRLPGSGPPPR